MPDRYPHYEEQHESADRISTEYREIVKKNYYIYKEGPGSLKLNPDGIYSKYTMRILLLDSDTILLEETVAYLVEIGIEPVVASNLEEAVEYIQKQLFDVIVIDVSGQNGNIVSLIDMQQTFNRNAPVIVTADFGHVHEAVKAVKLGAHNYIQKPYDSEDLHQKILKAIEFRRLELEAQNLRHERDIIYRPENFVSESPEMEKVLRMVKKVASTDTTVLLTGETGTGKELVSGAIHYNSSRAKKAFVKVNCAALPAQLLESELFGHEKGAFTGADKLRIGRFEQANEGSILLDEIAEIETSTQVKLLRVLQERVFERLGSNRPIKLNIRVMTATNRDLFREVQEQRFRQDLYYRLNVVNIHIPPLRERKKDILPLARYFLTKFKGEFGKSVKNLSPEAVQELLQHKWRGNVRELRNTIERAVLMSDHEIIGIDDLNLMPENDIQAPMDQQSEVQFVRIPAEGFSLKELEYNLILQALEAADYIQKDAAKLLKISPRVLNYKINKYGIKNPHWNKNT